LPGGIAVLTHRNDRDLVQLRQRNDLLKVGLHVISMRT
jgi:hypothetical protein